MNKVKAYFEKPSMPFSSIFLLGVCMFGLVIIAEANDGVITSVEIGCKALIATIVIALLIQVVRCANEILKER